MLVLFAMTVCALGADITFQWDNPPDNVADGTEIRFYSDAGLTQLVKSVDIPDPAAEEGKLTLDKGRYWTVAHAYTVVVNPDGTTPRIYSDPSNVLNVKISGNRGNVRVIEVTR